jgi:hypothetical protein
MTGLKEHDSLVHIREGRIYPPLLKRCPGSGALPVSRVSATHPNPAWHPKPSRLWPPVPPTLHKTFPRDAPESPRSTSDSNQRYYGETPVGLRWGYRGMSGR